MAVGDPQGQSRSLVLPSQPRPPGPAALHRHRPFTASFPLTEAHEGITPSGHRSLALSAGNAWPSPPQSLPALHPFIWAHGSVG